MYTTQPNTTSRRYVLTFSIHIIVNNYAEFTAHKNKL